MSNSSIWSIDWTLLGATISGQSGPKIDGNEEVPTHFPKLQHYWNLTIRLFSVISRTLVRGGLTPMQTCSRCIIQAQTTWDNLTVFNSDSVSSYLSISLYLSILTMIQRYSFSHLSLSVYHFHRQKSNNGSIFDPYLPKRPRQCCLPGRWLFLNFWMQKRFCSWMTWLNYNLYLHLYHA